MQSLRGQLLVAAPVLIDPNFHRTVVLVGEHGAEGAMGVVLNRPSGVTVSDAVAPLAGLTAEDDLVHVGGPVQTDAVVVLADFVEPDRSAGVVFDSVGFVPGEVDDPDELGELRSARVFAGYAGWGPGQLESELEEQAWIVVGRPSATCSRTTPTGSGAECFDDSAAPSPSSRSSLTIPG